MPIKEGAADVVKVYLGASEVDKVYQGTDLVFTRPALPQITRFTTLPTYLAASAGRSEINFIAQATGATSIAVADSDGRAIPYQSSPALTIAANDKADKTYTMTASNAEGSVTAHYTLVRTSGPAFASGLDVTYSQVAHPQIGVQYRVQVTWRITGTSNPFPTLQWIDPPSSHPFPDPNRLTTPDGAGAMLLTFTPGGERLTLPIRLRATNPLSGDTADATGTITVPARSG